LQVHQNKLKWMFFALQEKPFETTRSIKLKFTLLKILFLSVLRLNFLYFFQFLFLLKPDRKYENYLILASLSNHHHLNISRFCKLDISPFRIIETFNKASITSFEFIKVLPLYKEFFQNYFLAKEYILIGNLKYSTKELMQNIASSIAIYSYTSLLFQAIKLKSNSIEFYTGGAELASLAAINAGIRTHYITHGLLGLSAVPEKGHDVFIEQKIDEDSFPSFNSIHVYSETEKKFLEKKLPSSRIEIYKFNQIKKLDKTIVLFFDDTKEFFDLDKFQDIADFFQERNFQIIGKEHPCNSSEMPEKFCNKNNVKLLRDPSLSAYEVITKFKPFFVMGWPSTSLCEALNLGVIPICIPDVHPFFEFPNFYPFKNKTFSWTNDFALIQNALNDEHEYSNYLLNLKSYK